ncbi:MAG: hypothetical protein GQ565_10475 [Candidatus Aegiribacteria sp.]|nr:hypothetical protein [Candidatus Aegiribacteria sp.]
MILSVDEYIFYDPKLEWFASGKNLEIEIEAVTDVTDNAVEELQRIVFPTFITMGFRSIKLSKYVQAVRYLGTNNKLRRAYIISKSRGISTGKVGIALALIPIILAIMGLK